MKLPQGSSVPEDEEVMHYYLAQISIRKILNRAHSALYNSSHHIENPGWTISSADDLAEQLEQWRKILPERLKWKDTDEPATDINDARLRAKYYGAQYIIHRPFLHHVLQDEFEPNFQKQYLQIKTKQDIFGMGRKCINAAVFSTLAFDGLQPQDQRPIVTNIFGTTHAQFGNILVLCAAHRSSRHSWVINRNHLQSLIERTIEFVNNLTATSPTMRTNLKILENVKRRLRQEGRLDAVDGAYGTEVATTMSLGSMQQQVFASTATTPSSASNSFTTAK